MRFDQLAKGRFGHPGFNRQQAQWIRLPWRKGPQYSRAAGTIHGAVGRSNMRVPAIILLLSLGQPAMAVPELIWNDHFSEPETQKLRTWVERNHAGIAALLGTPPFDLTVHLQRTSNGREPVPWAKTNKHRDRSVYFYVDPAFPLEAFMDDWTGTHELLHLLFPYLGERGRWFAEGIATYLQFPAMVGAGSLDWEVAVDRMQKRLLRARALHDFDDNSIIDIGPRTWGPGANQRLYWGGAAYFLLVDQRLQQQTGQRLTDVLQAYVACCSKRWGENEQGLMRQLDRLSGSRIFTETYAETVSQPGFPEIDEALAWLRGNPLSIDG